MESKFSQRKHRRYRVALHHTGWQLGLALVLVFCATRAPAFSLLGPFTPWMTTTNGFSPPFGPPVTTFDDPNGDIGGPMNIGDGYRWNVPVVTYGFDKSFLDYFGSNGVAAVKGAIQILNNLPPASDIVLTNYPTQALQINYAAQAESLYDLKSMTLALLLEQMGLASPTRFIYVLRRFDPAVMYRGSSFLSSQYWWEYGIIPNQIVLRNFDPETLEPSTQVNGQFYSGYLAILFWPNQTLKYAIPVPFQANPLINSFAVADWIGIPSPGHFFDGLTRDDVGGLRYLLSSENINYETLLRSVHPAGRRFGLSNRRKHGFVNGAWRPGIDKITFVPQPVNSGNGRFLPTSYRYRDIYIQNNAVGWQDVKRRVTRPDILFCAADTGENKPYTPTFVRSGTTNWLNNAALNDNTNGEGPGVIQGPIKIIFDKLGPVISTGDFPNFYGNQGWASFDGSTNLPIIYPLPTYSDRTGFTIQLRFFDTDYSFEVPLTNITWHLPVPIGGQASLQVSTNQTDWFSLATVTNVGSVTEWDYSGSDNPPMYFRAVPQ